MRVSTVPLSPVYYIYWIKSPKHSALSARSLLVYIPHGFLHTPIISPSAVTNRSLLGIVWFIIIYLLPTIALVSQFVRNTAGSTGHQFLGRYPQSHKLILRFYRFLIFKVF